MDVQNCMSHHAVLRIVAKSTIVIIGIGKGFLSYASFYIYLKILRQEMIQLHKIKDFSKELKPYVDSVNTDILGNVIAHKMGHGKRIMLIAHQDVICLMISYIDERGFLYVKPSGGIDVSILQARKVVIVHENKEILGVIGKKPIHLLREEQNNKITFDNIWIDIGAKNKEEALQIISVGDYAYFYSDYESLPNSIITGPYIDNQAGLNVLCEVSKRFQKVKVNCNLYYVASNHEEIGLRGAYVAANSIKPDICICVDVTHATDYPNMNVISDGDIKLGGGCVLSKGPNVYPKLFQRLKEITLKNNITSQVEVSPYPTGTDANVVQLSTNGVKTIIISIPCRYICIPLMRCAQKKT